MARKLKILFVVDSIDYTVGGGSAISAKRFISALSKRGHEITIISNRVKNKTDTIYDNVKIIEISDFPFLHNKNFIPAFVFKKDATRILKKEKPDIVHLIYPPTFAGNAFGSSARKLNIPLVCHFHVQAENVSTYFSKFHFEKLVYKFFMHFYNKCDLVISPTKFAYDFAIKNGLKAKQVIISNGVDLTFFKKIKSKEITTSTFNFLYLGRLEKSKDIFTLLKAFKLLITKNPKVQLIIGGGGSLKQQIIEFVQKNNLQKYVKVLGFVKNEDLVNTYNNANAYVSPSLYELEGMSPLEAMSCGLPLIVSDSVYSAAKNLVEENGLLFKSKDSEDLCQKMKTLVLSNKMVFSMSNKSLQLSKKYSFEKSVLSLENTYLDVLRSK